MINNIKVLNKYSPTNVILNKTSYGSLIPIYTNESFNKNQNVIFEADAFTSASMIPLC